MRRNLVPVTLFALVIFAACGTDAPAASPTVDESLSRFDTPVPVPPTPIATATATALPTIGPTQTPSPTPTAVATPVTTATPTLTPTPFSAQPVSVNLAPQWVVGQSWDYELNRTKQRLNSGAVVSSNTSSSEVNIEVIDATTDGFVLGYTLVSTHLPSTGDAATDALLSGLAEITVGVTFEIEVGVDAVSQGIRNFDEIAPVFESLFSSLSELLTANASQADIENIESAIEVSSASFSTEEGVLTTGLPEIVLFLLSFGWELELGELYEVDDVLPTPFGGPPISVIAYIDLTDPDPGDSLFTFSWSQGFEGEEAEQALLDSLRLLAAQVGGAEPSIESVRGISRRDEGEFRIDTETWTLQELSFSQVVSIQSISDVDVTEMVLLR